MLGLALISSNQAFRLVSKRMSNPNIWQTFLAFMLVFWGKFSLNSCIKTGSIARTVYFNDNEESSSYLGYCIIHFLLHFMNINPLFPQTFPHRLKSSLAGVIDRQNTTLLWHFIILTHFIKRIISQMLVVIFHILFRRLLVVLSAETS